MKARNNGKVIIDNKANMKTRYFLFCTDIKLMPKHDL